EGLPLLGLAIAVPVTEGENAGRRAGERRVEGAFGPDRELTDRTRVARYDHGAEPFGEHQAAVVAGAGDYARPGGEEEKQRRKERCGAAAAGGKRHDEDPIRGAHVPAGGRRDQRKNSPLPREKRRFPGENRLFSGENGHFPSENGLFPLG